MNKRNTSLIIRTIALLAAGTLAANSAFAQEKTGAATDDGAAVDTTHPWYGVRVGIYAGQETPVTGFQP